MTIPVKPEVDHAFDHGADRETQVIGLQPGQTPRRVLVADDNTDNRTLLSSMLEQVGFTVREVVNGEGAVEAFTSWEPHLICMDMRMPVMDGYTAVRTIRKLPGGDKVKVLAVTASVFEEQGEEILNAGCDELVTKPIREYDLFAAIERQLGVAYRYADIETPHGPNAGPELTGKMLSELPPEMLAELHQAALVLDKAVLAELIERIKAFAPDTAKGLQRLVDGFQFERIRDLLGDVT